MEINILIDEGVGGCPGVEWLESTVERIAVAQGIGSEAELSLVIVGWERIQQLNRTYLGEDSPTDVMAFPMLSEQVQGETAWFVMPPDGKKHLGEVIICFPQAVVQAEEHQHSVEREIAILIIHGVLHLLGYDHDRPEVEREMRNREAEILTSIEGEPR